MRESLSGRLLVASPVLEDPNFARTVVLVCSHSEEGALGLVLNRPMTAPVRQVLLGWTGAIAEPKVVFNGGPVAPCRALALGRTADVEEETAWATPVLPGIGMINLARVTPMVELAIDRMRVFSGHASWGASQLETEIMREDWFVVDALPEDALTPQPDRIWHEVLRRQPGRLALFAHFPSDPILN